MSEQVDEPSELRWMLASSCRLALVLAVSYVLSAAVFGGWSLLAGMSKGPNILTVIFAIGNFIEFLRTGGQPGDWLGGTTGSTNMRWLIVLVAVPILLFKFTWIFELSQPKNASGRPP